MHANRNYPISEKRKTKKKSKNDWRYYAYSHDCELQPLVTYKKQIFYSMITLGSAIIYCCNHSQECRQTVYS